MFARRDVRSGCLWRELVCRHHGGKPRAQTAGRRARRRCLRHRRRPRRPYRGARDRPARLVGRPGGGEAHRLGCLGAQRGLRRAGILGEHREHRRAGRAAARRGIVGALAERRRIRPQHDPRDRDAGRGAGRGPADRAENRSRGGLLARGRNVAREFPRRGGDVADRARARGVAQPALFPGATFSGRVPDPSAQLRARACGGGGASGRADLRKHLRDRHRYRGRAQAGRHAAGARSRGPDRAGGRPRPRAGVPPRRRHAATGLELHRRHRAARRAAP